MNKMTEMGVKEIKEELDKIHKDWPKMTTYQQELTKIYTEELREELLDAMLRDITKKLAG